MFKKTEKMLNNEYQALHQLPDISEIIELRMVSPRWTRSTHEEMINADRILIGISERKQYSGRPK